MSVISEADQRLIDLAFPDRDDQPVSGVVDYNNSTVDSKIKGINKTQPKNKAQSANNVSWKDLAKSIKPTPKSDVAPVISPWDRGLLFEPRVLASSPDYVLCKHCKRPTLVKVLSLHVTACLERKAQEKEREKESSLSRVKSVIDVDQDDDINTNGTNSSRGTPVANGGAGNTNSNLADEPTPIKKRKKDSSTADISANGVKTEDEASPAKKSKTTAKPGRKKKDKAEAAAAAAAARDKKLQEKNKPVDVEKQCGVPLGNGQLCARSLTCKSHSMGAKRAVVGRSAPYDVLLAQYQRRNQVKMASKSASQHIAEDNEALASSVAVNPDEEARLVMEGVRRSSYAPLDQRVISNSYSKKHFFCMREMLASALLPQNQGLGGIFGRAAAFQVDNPSTLHFVRPIARTTPVNNTRR